MTMLKLYDNVNEFNLKTRYRMSYRDFTTSFHICETSGEAYADEDASHNIPVPGIVYYCAAFGGNGEIFNRLGINQKAVNIELFGYFIKGQWFPQRTLEDVATMLNHLVSKYGVSIAEDTA